MTYDEYQEAARLVFEKAMEMLPTDPMQAIYVFQEARMLDKAVPPPKPEPEPTRDDSFVPFE